MSKMRSKMALSATKTPTDSSSSAPSSSSTAPSAAISDTLIVASKSTSTTDKIVPAKTAKSATKSISHDAIPTIAPSAGAPGGAPISNIKNKNNINDTVKPSVASDVVNDSGSGNGGESKDVRTINTVDGIGSSGVVSSVSSGSTAPTNPTTTMEMSLIPLSVVQTLQQSITGIKPRDLFVCQECTATSDFHLLSTKMSSHEPEHGGSSRNDRDPAVVMKIRRAASYLLGFLAMVTSMFAFYMSGDFDAGNVDNSLHDLVSKVSPNRVHRDTTPQIDNILDNITNIITIFVITAVVMVGMLLLVRLFKKRRDFNQTASKLPPTDCADDIQTSDYWDSLKDKYSWRLIDTRAGRISFEFLQTNVADKVKALSELKLSLKDGVPLVPIILTRPAFLTNGGNVFDTISYAKHADCSDNEHDGDNDSKGETKTEHKKSCHKPAYDPADQLLDAGAIVCYEQLNRIVLSYGQSTETIEVHKSKGLSRVELFDAACELVTKDHSVAPDTTKLILVNGLTRTSGCGPLVWEVTSVRVSA